MQVHQADPQGWLSYVVPAIVIGLVLFLRLRRVNKARPLRLDRLWIVPALYGAIVVLTFAAQPPSASGWAASAVGLLVGAAFGWQRGRAIRIHIDPETGELNQRASIAGMLFLVVLIFAKSAVQASGAAMHVSLATLTDALLAFALATFTAMRVEMYLRAKRLIASSRDPAATTVL